MLCDRIMGMLWRICTKRTTCLYEFEDELPHIARVLMTEDAITVG